MTTVPQGTLNWLYNVLSKDYRDPNRAYSDLAHTLSLHPTLSPRTEVYTFENGTSALLLHFVGTIPVVFRGATYRFPIALWLPHGYPQEAPMVYIRPTDDMLVRPGQHVSGEGRVYHHYLAHWSEAWNRVNVVDLLHILSDVFAKEPPVISKQEMISMSRTDQSSPIPPPRPPLPEELQRSSPTLQSHTPVSSTPPLPPPKPVAGEDVSGVSPAPRQGRYDAPLPLPHEINDGRSASPPSRPNGYSSGPQNQPQFAPQRSTSLRQSLATQQIQRSMSSQYQSQTTSDFRTSSRNDGSPSISSPVPQRPLSTVTRPSVSSQSLSYQSHPTQQQISSPISQSRLQPASPIRPQSYNASSGRLQAQPKAHPIDLLSSPFDVALPTNSPSIPAPPVPRNPEKDAMLGHLSRALAQAVQQKVSQNYSALTSLRAQNTALGEAHAKLNSELPQLTNLQSVLQSNINILQNALASADRTISAAHSRSTNNDLPPVDEMVVPPTVVAKQLYDTVCEERGIEAGLWALQTALGRSKIGAEAWAKRSREVAREGFKKKWLARKIGRGMGLGDGG